MQHIYCTCTYIKSCEYKSINHIIMATGLHEFKYLSCSITTCLPRFLSTLWIRGILTYWNLQLHYSNLSFLHVRMLQHSSDIHLIASSVFLFSSVYAFVPTITTLLDRCCSEITRLSALSSSVFTWLWFCMCQSHSRTALWFPRTTMNSFFFFF